MGGSAPVAQAYIADVTTVEQRPKYLGLVGACSSGKRGRCLIKEAAAAPQLQDHQSSDG